jgi:FMN reductase
MSIINEYGDHDLYVVGIGGTLRPDSSTEKALRFVMSGLRSSGAVTQLLAGADLGRLSMYNPNGMRQSDSPARQLLDALSNADAVVLASPAYHGSVSGLVKNALDYIEDLRDGPRVYLHGLPVACIATGAGWQGVVATVMQLRTIVHSLRGWPTPLGVAINTTERAFGDDEEPVGKVRDQLEMLQAELLGQASMRRRETV